MQRKVVLWGTFGAIAIRAALTTVVVYLLKIPGFLSSAASRLSISAGNSPGQRRRPRCQTSHVGAGRGADNHHCRCGDGRGQRAGGRRRGTELPCCSCFSRLAISIPLWSGVEHLYWRWVERFAAIIWIGAGVLGWTAVKIDLAGPLLAPWLGGQSPARLALQIIVSADSSPFRCGAHSSHIIARGWCCQASPSRGS